MDGLNEKLVCLIVHLHDSGLVEATYTYDNIYNFYEGSSRCGVQERIAIIGLKGSALLVEAKEKAWMQS